MKSVISTHKAPAAIGPYSQAIKSGNMLFTSGQIPIDPATSKVVDGDIEVQAHQALKDLGAILKEAGADYSSVVKTTVFVTDLANFKTVNDIYSKYFIENHPARSCVQVAALPLGVEVEIEAIAILG